MKERSMGCYTFLTGIYFLTAYKQLPGPRSHAPSWAYSYEGKIFPKITGSIDTEETERRSP